MSIFTRLFNWYKLRRYTKAVKSAPREYVAQKLTELAVQPDGKVTSWDVAFFEVHHSLRPAAVAVLAPIILADIKARRIPVKPPKLDKHFRVILRKPAVGSRTSVDPETHEDKPAYFYDIMFVYAKNEEECRKVLEQHLPDDWFVMCIVDEEAWSASKNLQNSDLVESNIEPVDYNTTSFSAPSTPRDYTKIV